MATATEPTSKLFEQTYDSLRSAAESALKMQREMYGQWAKMWPTGFSPSAADMSSGAQKFQQEWSEGVAEMMHKHRELLDRQYGAGIESLEQAFQLAGSENPEELRERCETLCRNALDLMKETSQSQMQQFQEAMNKWVELCQTKR